MSTEPKNPGEQDHPLAAKNRELLDELKQARAQIAEMQGQVEATTAKLTDVTLTRPAQKLLDKLSISKYAAMELADHLKFDLDESGALQVMDSKGQPLKAKLTKDGKTEERRVEANYDDLYRYLADAGSYDELIIGTRATGGGASSQRYTPPTDKPAKSQAQAPMFGLGAR